MTKVREPLSFEKAICRIAEVVEWAAMAALVGRTERAVQFWGEEKKPGSPTLVQAMALDLAFQRAGGVGFPILESYAAQLDVTVTDDLACRDHLIALIGNAAAECGEAYEHALAVIAPGATPAKIRRAITETEEAAGVMSTLLRSLARFLKPAGVAGPGTLGGAQ